MPQQRRRKSDQIQSKVAKGSIVALIVSSLTAAGILGPKALSALDIQSANAAEEIHEKIRTEFRGSVEKVRDELREQHTQTTERLDRIFEAVSRGR